MSTYAVELTEAALTAIRDQAHFIAVERCSPVNAERWLEQVWEAVDSLEQFPRRVRLAGENDDVEYEVREIHVGGPALLFTVDEERNTVWVIALRGEGQLARPEILPGSHERLEAERRIKVLRRALIEAGESGDSGELDIEGIIREARRQAGLPTSPARATVKSTARPRVRRRRVSGVQRATLEDVLLLLRNRAERKNPTRKNSFETVDIDPIMGCASHL